MNATITGDAQRSATRILIRYAAQEGRRRARHYVELQQGYTPLIEWIGPGKNNCVNGVAIASRTAYGPSATNMIGSQGAFRDNEPDVPRLVEAVATLRRLVGRELPVQYNGTPHADIPEEWSVPGGRGDWWNDRLVEREREAAWPTKS